MAYLYTLYQAIDNLNSLQKLWPEIIIAGLLVFAIVGESTSRSMPSIASGVGAIIWLGLIAAGGSTYWSMPSLASGIQEQVLFNGLLAWTPLVTFFRFVSISAAGLTLWAMRIQEGAVSLVRWAFVLSTLLAAHLLVMATHWLMVHLSLGLLSLATALLIYSPHSAVRSIASLQYLLYSTAVLALMLWSVSFLYGFGHDLSFAAWTAVVTHPAVASSWLYVGVLCLLSGVLFTVAAFPYHFWVSDAYAAAPPTVVAYLATVPKLAGIACLLRICASMSLSVGSPSMLQAQHLMAFIALVTIVVGNVKALAQREALRLMAYASVAQGGLLMAGVVACPADCVGLLYYGIAYSIGSFAVLLSMQWLTQLTGQRFISGYAGVGRQFPLPGICLVVAMISLVGLPPTPGFIGKFLILCTLWEKAVHSQSPVFGSLFVVSMLSTVASLYYYLKIPYSLFSQSAAPPTLTLSARHKMLQWLVIGLVCLLVGMVVSAQSCLHLLRQCVGGN